MICNIRMDTVLYDLPPAPTGKRGRPRKRGDRLTPEQFDLSAPEAGDWKIGIRPVRTNLFGERTVYAIVTSHKTRESSYRLFLCTKNPEEISMDYAHCANKSIHDYGMENIQYLPLGLYSLRWNIEVSYYEGKTFWSMENYRVRTKEGIERLANLMSISYSAMTLLPYSDETFSCYQSASAQETRFEIGQQIQGSIIFNGFVATLETVNKFLSLIKAIETYILSGFRKNQNL